MTSPRESLAKATNALAALIHEIRPDWHPPGIVAALRNLPPNLPLSQLAIAAIRYADDPNNLTPAHLPDLTNRAWDTDWHPTCKHHPGNRAHRPDGECAGCYADRNATRDPQPLNRRGKAPAPEIRQVIVAAFNGPRSAPKPRVRPKPDNAVMAAVRAELDQVRATAAVVTDPADVTGEPSVEVS